MHSRVRSVMIALGTAIAVNVFWLTAGSVSGQAPAEYRAPRASDGHPDLNGIWQAFTTANWDILPHPAEPGLRPEIMGAYGSQPGGLGIVEGGELPYRPEALAQKKKNFDNRMTPKVTNDPSRFDFGDPEIQCYRPGIPRANYMPYPFQIFQGADQIQFVYEFKGALRTVYMDPHREAPDQSWMGWANGRWEGETLVIENTDFNAYTWFDRAGNYHSDELKVVERYTPIDATHMQYEATIDDPKIFTRPWKMSFPLYRRIEPNVQLVEFNCVPFVEELMYAPLGLFKRPQ